MSRSGFDFQPPLEFPFCDGEFKLQVGRATYTRPRGQPRIVGKVTTYYAPCAEEHITLYMATVDLAKEGARAEYAAKVAEIASANSDCGYAIRADEVTSALATFSDGVEGVIEEQVNADSPPGDVPRELATLPRTDAGNAEAFGIRFEGRYTYEHTRQKWMRYQAPCWRDDDVDSVWNAAVEVVRNRGRAAGHLPQIDECQRLKQFALQSENKPRLTALLALAEKRPELAVTIERFDANPMLAGVFGSGGQALDLKTGAIREAGPEDFLTRTLGAAYDPDAKCLRWLRFLDEVFQGDKELIGWVQRAVGYSLTGDTREQCLFFCLGSGANGKSIFLRVLAALAGGYAANTPFATFDSEARGDASNDLAMLRGSRLVTAIESEEDRRLAEARVKAVTGQDPITCRFLYKEFFTYTPQFKLWLAMNHRPAIIGSDHGIWRRIRLIPFARTFTSDEQDKDLGATLQAELSGILNWALQGLAAWHEQGLGTCAVVAVATEEYRAESDVVGQWLAEATQAEDGAKLPAASAYSDYQLFCDANGHRPLGQAKFARRLTERGIDRDKDNKGKRCYTGLHLLPRIVPTGLNGGIALVR